MLYVKSRNSFSHRNVNDSVDLNSIFKKAGSPILSDTMRDILEGHL